MTTTPATATETPAEAEGQQEQERKLLPRDPRNASRVATRLTWRDISTGDMAGLRRLDAKRLTSPAFWKVCLQFGLDYAPRGALEIWAEICRAMAKGSKVGEKETTGPHDGNLPLGRALAQAGYSQNRLKTLLDADPAALRPLTERMAVFLNSKGQRFNWNDAARLMLTEHRTLEDQERDRARIARDYYREVNRQERGQTANEE